MSESDSMGRTGIRGKRAFRTAAITLWIVMMLWLVRYEAFPEYFSHYLDGYQSLVSKDLLVMDSWMRVLFKGAPIGYSHTSMEVDESNPAHYYLINNRVQVKLKVMGEAQSIRVDTSAMLNLVSQLQNFTFGLSSPGYSLTMKADRVGERQFTVFLKTGTSRQLMKVDIPPDVVLYSPMTEMAMKKLKPGQEMSVKTLDPATMKTAIMAVRALQKETITVVGKEYETTALSVEYQGVTVQSWIDGDGQIVRQQTPFGWTMEKCTIDDAFAALEASGKAEDMLTGMAVPCKGKILNARGSSDLKLRLKGVAFSKEELETNRQTVEQISGTEAVLRVKAGSIPSLARREAAQWLRDGGSVPDDFKPLLAASAGIQADHREIAAQAREIVGRARDPLEKATLIFEWVYKNVQKKMTISLPSALDVLRTMQGDCNEHTYLYVALARAAGVPAKVKVGLAYHKGAFYYHAWPAVYIGEWLEMDPTWGEVAVDAAHLALVEGELADQVKLLRVMGQLKIEVIEGRKGRDNAEGAE